MNLKWNLWSIRVLVCVGLVGGCGQTDPDPPSEALPASHQATPVFVGSQTCQTCHVEAFELWQASHHALAMQPASPATVLADLPYSDAELSISGDQNGYQVTTHTQPEKALTLSHTFGVEPLQQYLVETGNGRLQTLRHSWDTRSAAEGGQRWFLQYEGEEIPPGDVLHWQGIAQNWNSMCADCHTTNFRKGYDSASGGFNSSYSETGVGCEACHGPGSHHLNDPTTAMPAQQALASPASQAEVCAPCHARREQIAEGFTAGANLLDHYVPQLLNPPLYHPDGQIDDEVYVYGSFVSSKMFKRGVTCNDCHEPHSAGLKIPGDGVCLQCHNPAGNPRFGSLTLKVDYTSTDHHRHDPTTTAARCVTCHMPSKTYMGVDIRHDHSLRIPNPVLSNQTQTPNPCASCHAEMPELWFAAPDHFGRVLAGNAISGEASLARLANDPSQTALVRATALSRLANPRQTGAVRAFEQASRDPDGLIRHTAATGIPHLRPAIRMAAYKRLLADPLRAVRAQTAAIALANLDPTERLQLEPEFSPALAEHMAANQLNAERPSANVNLAIASLQLGDNEAAEQYLVRALDINDSFVPALLNYADLMRAQNRDREAEALLLKAVNLELAIPEADYAYAMWLVRNGSRELALIHLRRAFETDPGTPQWSYTYAIALHSLGQSNAALELLRGLQGRAVYQEQLMYLHASIARDVLLGVAAEQAAQSPLLHEAQQIAAELLERAPSNPNYQALSDALNQ